MSGAPGRATGESGGMGGRAGSILLPPDVSPATMVLKFENGQMRQPHKLEDHSPPLFSQPFVSF